VPFSIAAAFHARWPVKHPPCTLTFHAQEEIDMSAFAAKAEMLINAPRDQVFAALTERETLCKFWLADASSDLALGAKVEWTFMVPGAKDTIEVLDFDKGTYLKFKWSGGSFVEMSFTDHTLQSTRVSVFARAIPNVDEAIGTTEGFAIVLCDLKCLLETGASGGMVLGAATLIAASTNARE